MLALPVHNEALVGDEITTLSLNFEWRKIVSSALLFYFSHGKTALAYENEDLFDDLLIDLYSVELFGVSFLPRVLQKNIGADRSTISAVFVLVTGSNISHTPSKANFRVTCHGISLSNSSNDNSFVQVRFDGLEGAEQAIGRVTNTAAREVSCSAIFNDVSVGVAHDLALYFRANASAAVISVRSEIIYLIEEWE